MSLSPEPPFAGSSSASAPAPAQAHPQIPIEGSLQSTAPGAQRPTLTNTHIRSVADAQKLFYAVQLGMLPKIERRLDAVERKRLRPGDVYVWEERGATGLFAGASAGVAVVAKEGMAGPAEAAGYEVGIERWTEGLSWSASRIRDEFLIYFENVKKKERGVDREGHRARSLENQVLREGDRDMYIKQTYSVLRLDVNQEEGTLGASTAAVERSTSSANAADNGDKKDIKKKPRKWHLNAYFTKSTEGNLNTIDTIPWLRDLEVPEGIFTSARQSKKTAGGSASSPSSSGPASTSTSQAKQESQGEDASSLGKRSRAAPSVQRTYAAFPTGERRTHPRPVVPAPPPPPPPLPPGAAISGSSFGAQSASSQPPARSIVQVSEEIQGAPSNAPGSVPGAMHILVPEPNGSAVQTVPLEPIDTGVARMAPGGAASPASAGGVHVNTVGLYRMHIGESGASERMRTDMSEHPRPDAFGDPSAFGGTGAFGDVGNAGRPFGQGGLPSQFGRGAFEFGQQQQLRELQRFQERQHAQQREQQQFYGAGGFDFDAGQPFHPHTSMQAHAPTQTRSQHHLPAHTSPHSHSSPHAYSPMQRTLQGSHAQHPHSPIHTLSPALSDFRAGSEYSHSSSSSSSRGGSVSSGSGSVRMLAGAGGAWSPQSGVDFGGYHIKSEYSELGMAFGQVQGAGQGAEAMFGAGAGDGEDEDEDLSGYLPMPPLPVALTEPAEASAGRRRATSRRAASDTPRGGHSGERRVDVADMSELGIQPHEGVEDVEGTGDYYGLGGAHLHLMANGSSNGVPGSSSSLIDALLTSASSHPMAMSPPPRTISNDALSPTMALPSVPSVPPQPITMPSAPLVPDSMSVSLPNLDSILDANPGEGLGKYRRALAPLHQLQRAHPYRYRSRIDDRALRLLGPAPAPGAKDLPRGLQRELLSDEKHHPSILH